MRVSKPSSAKYRSSVSGAIRFTTTTHGPNGVTADASPRSGFASEAIRLNKQWHIGHSTIADATGAAPSTVRDWLAGRSAPTGERARRVADLAEIADRLGNVIRDDYISVWLVKPIRALDDERPVELIRADRVRDVSKVIAALESPVAG
jgi:transcriptional regulator with XRE-family HTH domain